MASAVSVGAAHRSCREVTADFAVSFGQAAEVNDSSALVRLAIREPESAALRRNLGPRRPLVSRALARTEVVWALVPLGSEAVQRGRDVLARMDLLRLNIRVLDSAGMLTPPNLRSLDAIHLASAEQLGSDLRAS
jgi:predicted nucleic acid-binding protein